MKKASILAILLWVCAMSYAQSLEERYRAFQQAAQQHYSDFRGQANAAYADFLRAAWEYYQALPAIPKPEDNPQPPVIYEDKEQRNQEHEGELVPQPKPAPTPQPVSPVIENNEQTDIISLSYYGIELRFRAPKGKAIRLRNAESEQIATAWETLAGDAYANLLYDCLSAREKYELCDWAYLTMLQQVAEKLYGSSNEAVLMQAFLYANSGYKMRLAVSGNKLHLLIGSAYTFYGRKYYQIEGEKFYTLDDLSGNASICGASFEQEKPLSLLIAHEQYFPAKPVAMKERKGTQGVACSCSINKNLIDFYNTYPTGHYGNDFGTRWAAYANSPMDKSIQAELYPQLKAAIEGSNEAKAVGLLLNWVQTGFTYKYDDEVWGGDRAFFPAESLHYPYCDCEDRSILFSRLVRDLLGLDVVLIYYPGHLATAVAFNESVRGDYLVVNGRRFTICDPTYIGAPVGATMTNMDNKTAQIIPLK